jgi:hypothetical protein
MIVASRETPPAIGTRIEGLLWDAKRRTHHFLPHVVLRTATYAEWLAEYGEVAPDYVIEDMQDAGVNFYEVQVD